MLKQLLKRKDVVVDIKVNDVKEESLLLYENAKPADYFMMVIQGAVDVTVGVEGFSFSRGAFSYFCQDALLSAGSVSGVYVPDYSVKVSCDTLLIKVTTEIYKQALLSTKLKKWETGELEEGDLLMSDNRSTGEISETDSTPAYQTPRATPILPRTRK